MSVEPKTISQWEREGFTEEEIRAYSVIGLVLCDEDPLVAVLEALELSTAALRQTLPYVGGKQAAAIGVQLASNRAAIAQAKGEPTP